MKRLVTKAFNLFSDKQSTRLEVNNHWVVNCRMTERLDDFTLEDFLSALEFGYVGLQHEVRSDSMNGRLPMVNKRLNSTLVVHLQ
jgi:hypothetical protein